MRIARVLAFAAAAFGIAAVVATLCIVLRTYSPVLVWDQWEMINTLIESHGHPSVHHLWAQHNEHRPLTGRLFGFADLYLFGGRNVTLLVEIFAFQLCHLLLLLAVLRRFGSLPATVYVTLAAFLTYCLFSPVQIENFVWGFQTVFVLASLAVTACCAAALWHAHRIAKANSRGGIALLLVAVALAFIAESSDAHGLMAWPVLLFLAFAFRLPTRDRIVIFVAAGLAIGAYLMGYESPNAPHTEKDALGQPLRAFHFVLTYFANSWDADLPNTSAWPSVSEFVATVAIATTLVGSAWCLWRPTAFSLLQITLLGNLLFGLASAAMTAVGRLQYGDLQAIALRYQTPALVFWGSLASLIAVSVDWTRPRRLLVAQATLLILMLVGAGRWLTVAQWAEKRQTREEVAWNALVENPSDESAARQIFYEPDMLKTFVPYLRQHGWGPPGKITSFARLQGVSRSPQIQGYQSLAKICIGHWDVARRSGLTSVSVGGWALSQLSGQMPRRVAFASGSGKVIGYAELNSIRQDVATLYPRAQSVKTGWEANLTVPGEDVYHAFLLFEDDHAACLLANELRIGDYPIF